MKYKFYIKKPNEQAFWLRWSNGDLRVHPSDRISSTNVEIRHRYGNDVQIRVFAASYSGYVRGGQAQGG